MPPLPRALISLVAAACIGAGPIATASDFTLTLSMSQTTVARDQTPAVQLTLKNVSDHTLYLDPLNISLFYGFHLVDLASGAESDIIGEHTLVDLPPHAGAPLLPGASITLVSHLLPIHQIGGYRVTAKAMLDLPSQSTVIHLVATNPVFLLVRTAIPDSEIDAHIDAGIPAERRAYVHEVMLSLPPTMRDGAVAGYDKDGRFFSNRLADYGDVTRLNMVAASKIPRAVDPAIVGSWTCTDVLNPRATMALIYHADGTGSEWGQATRFGTDGTYVYSLRTSSGAARDAYAIHGDTLRRTTAGYWHDEEWTSLSSAHDLDCRRAG